MKILAIEDELNMQKLIEYNLRHFGYEALMASNGRHGVDLARKESPDLIFLDMMLPEMDGMETLRALKENPVTRPIPVIMLTARGQRSDVEQALAEGAAAYITKPFDPATLKQMVERFASAKSE
ncbi:MAG: CheY-like chemotaxis protein [Kiritimatiellia bacterium]|jgi:CheY-like chemotaxis protein